jgi:transposase InsO family protein
MVYIAFVIDVYSRRILGWCAAISMRRRQHAHRPGPRRTGTALWTRRREGQGKHKSANRPGTRRAAGSQMPGEPRCQRR